MRNYALIFFALLLFSSCSHVVTMKSAGTSVSEKGELTIYFKHKDKISYAVKEPYQIFDDSNGEDNGEASISSDKSKLIISSKDGKTIDNIFIKSGKEKKDVKFVNFYGVEYTNVHDHNHTSPSRSHRKWHIIGEKLVKYNVPDLNSATLRTTKDIGGPDTRRVALTSAQHQYLVDNGITDGYFYYLADTNNSNYSRLGTASYNGRSIYSFFDSGFDYYAVHQVGTLHFHHYRLIRRVGNNFNF